MKYLIALIALATPAYLIRFSIGGVPTTALEILIYLCFFYGLVNMAYCQWGKTKHTICIAIGLFLLAAIISVYVSPEKIVALGQFKALFIDPLLVLYLMLAYLEVKDLKWVIFGLIGSSLIVSLHTIILKITGQVTPDGRVIGLFGYSPNYLALFLVPMAVISFAYGAEILKKNQTLAVICGSIFLLDLLAIIFSGSRGGVLAILVGLTFYFIIKFWSIFQKNFGYRVGLTAVILVAAISAGWLFRPNFSLSAAEGGRVTSSNNVRWQIWQTSIELIKNNSVLGVGLGNYQNAFNELTKDRVNFPEYITPLALTPHDVFLMFYLSTGLLGLIAFIWILIIFYRIGFKHLHRQLALILLTVMTALLSQGLVDTPYFKNDLAVIFWLIVGMMIILGRSDSRRTKIVE